MNKYIKKLSVVTGLFFTSFSLVGCQSSSSEIKEEVSHEIVEEEHGEYDLGEVSQLASRRGVEFVGFLQKAYNPMGYPVSASIRYDDISSFSVLITNDGYYVVKDYQEDKQLNTYYDFLRGGSVPSYLSITDVFSLEDYRSHNEDLFTSSISDCYSSFTIYDCSSLLQEDDYNFDDLSSSMGEKYLGISRVSTTGQNTCYITYVPMEDVDVVGNSYDCNLIESYNGDISNSVFQADLLDGNKASVGENMEVTDFSTFVQENADSFSLELVDFVNSSEVSSYCISNQEFSDAYDASMVLQKTK